jgi:hypothetical protein
MPIGTGQNQGIAPTLYPSQVAAAYKFGQDLNGAILSNPFGSLYVYPNNPNAMSVLVDPAFNIPQLPYFTPPGPGTTEVFTLNGAASPVTVSLTAPGSNSYYATIYWNPNSTTTTPFPPSGVGVVYGSASATPVPILPADASFIPLAIVLISSSTVAITSAMIYDVRLWFRRGPVRSYIPAASTAQTVNCQGATNVVVDITITTSLTLTLTPLQLGIPVYIIATNSAGSASTLTIANALYLFSTKQAGTASALSTPGSTMTVPIGAGKSWIISGMTELGSSQAQLVAPYA